MYLQSMLRKYDHFVLPVPSIVKNVEILPVTQNYLNLDFMLPSCEYFSNFTLSARSLLEHTSVRNPLSELAEITLHTKNSVLKGTTDFSQSVYPLALEYALEIKFTTDATILASALAGPVFVRVTFTKPQRLGTIALNAVCNFTEQPVEADKVSHYSSHSALLAFGYCNGDFCPLR